MYVCVRACRLIKWNKNEKWVKRPGNKTPKLFFFFFFLFIFHCPVEVQLCRECIFLFHAGINSDVHLILPKSELETNTTGDLCVIREERACNIKVLTSLEEINRDSHG